MKDKKAFLWATIGGLVVAILLPFLSMAVQTYVLPTGTTGQRTEMLTNAPNRDEAMRSSFSGAAAPTTPTPLAGQLWMDTANDVLNVRNAAATAWAKLLRSGSVAKTDLPAAVAYEDEANVFTANQKVEKAVPEFIASAAGKVPVRLTNRGLDLGIVSVNASFDGTNWNRDDTTKIASIIQAAGDGDDNFTLYRAASGANPITFTTLVNFNNVGKMTAGTVPTGRLAAEVACAAGYTDVRGWCMDTDGTLASIASSSTYTLRTVNLNAKLAMIQLGTRMIVSGGSNHAVAACVIPGDAANNTCSVTTGALASESRFDTTASQVFDVNTVTLRTDSSGQIKNICVIDVGSTASCFFHIVGYMP